MTSRLNRRTGRAAPGVAIRFRLISPGQGPGRAGGPRPAGRSALARTQGPVVNALAFIFRYLGSMTLAVKESADITRRECHDAAMGGKERPGSSPHRRRQAARWLLAGGGILLVIGVIVFIVGTASVFRGAASPRPTNTVSGISSPGSTGSASPSPGSTGSGSPSVAAGSSPWNATNVFGGITAITGLIGALTGLVSLRAARHQVPATVYVMAAQPPMASPGTVSIPPGSGEAPGLSGPRATGAGPAEADRAGENNQAP